MPLLPALLLLADTLTRPLGALPPGVTDGYAATIRGERFACAADFMWMEDMARVLRDHLGADARKVPSRRMPTPVLKLMALFSRDIRQIAGEVGKRKVVSGQHAKDKLGWTTLPVEQTVLDTARSLIAQGVVKL